MQIREGDDEIVVLAKKLRSSINLSEGFFDLRACMEVADALEAMAFGQETKQKSHDIFYKIPAIHVEILGALGKHGMVNPELGLTHLLSLPSRASGHYLNMFLSRPGEVIAIEEICERLGIKFSTLKVDLSRTRKRLAQLGIPDAIKSAYSKGYYMPVNAAEHIGRLINVSLDRLPET